MKKTILLVAPLMLMACEANFYPTQTRNCQSIDDALKQKALIPIEQTQNQQHEVLRLIKLYQQNQCDLVLPRNH